MTEQDSINEIFFKFLMQYQFEEQDLDYTFLDKHKVALQTSPIFVYKISVAVWLIVKGFDMDYWLE